MVDFVLAGHEAVGGDEIDVGELGLDALRWHEEHLAAVDFFGHHIFGILHHVGVDADAEGAS